MTCMMAVIDKKTENKQFLILLFKTVLPLLIQSFFMQSINFINQLMVSSLGTEAIAAVGSSNKLLSLYNSFLYGSCSGCAMFMAQYWGKKDIKSFQKILGVTITATMTMGTVVTAAVLIVPGRLIGIFTNDPVVIELGITYTRAVAFSYFLMGIVFPLNFSLRSMNKVKVTMISTIISVILDCAVNYVLIFGKFGFPAMGVAGAGIGTVITRVIELTVLITYFKATKNPVLSNIRHLFSFGKSYVVSFIQKALPLVGNEIMWSLGTTIYFIIYGTAGTDALAAMSIMQTMQMLAKLFTGGFSGASSIIIGNEIGKGDISKVNRFCKKFHLAAAMIGLLSSVLVFAAIRPVLNIYNINGTTVGDYVGKCMLILSIFIVLNSCNSINVEGIFRSGGDVKFITLMDMGSIWFIGMPFTVITGLIVKSDIIIVYMAFILLELYKLPLGYYRFKSGKWLHRLHESTEKNKNRKEVISYGNS